MDTIQRIDMIDFREIKISNYIEEWGIDTENLYNDIVANDANFLPENLFNISEELAKIEDVTIRNVLFEQVMQKAQTERRRMGKISEAWTKYYLKNYGVPAEKNKLILYYYLCGAEQNYNTFVINGKKFQKTQLTNTQQLQLIFNETVSTRPMTLNEMLNDSLQRREASTFSPHSYIQTQSSSNRPRLSQREGQPSMTSFNNLD